MRPKNLLSKLSSLEEMLKDFSFEELNTNEASRLKKSFESFKKNLEKNIFEQPVPSSENLADFEKVPELKKETTPQDEGMLIARVSHEMRTPLNGIIGFTGLLKEDNLTEKQKEQVHAIESASHNLMEIINELMEYSKLSAGAEEFESVDFNFHSLIADVMYLCNTLITKSKVKLRIDIDPDIPEILIGDPSKISQVLLNLLGNAIKFVNEGKIHLKVTKKKQQADSFILEFQISDTGIGIAGEHLEYIFDSFKQAGQNLFANHGGYGLGLSIVKQIVENLGGQIKVSSTLGLGTTFEFGLPFKKGNAKGILSPLKYSLSNIKEKDKIGGMKVLVFEDNLLNQRLIQQRLNTWKCRVHVTDNALYGLNILRQQKIDIVLMDLRMPGMSGFEVTKKIRNSNIAYIREIPIIAVSADFTMRDREQCQSHGINDFILKPYSPDELFSKLIANTDLSSEGVSEIQMKKNPVIAKSALSVHLDLSHMFEECGGEIGLLEELLRLYKQNALEFIGISKIALQQKDFETLKFGSHKIKSGLAMLKTYSLHTIVSQIYFISDTSQDLNQLNFLHNCFTSEYPVIEKAMDKAFNELKNSQD